VLPALLVSSQPVQPVLFQAQEELRVAAEQPA
jgi:hypothetical protein